MRRRSAAIGSALAEAFAKAVPNCDGAVAEAVPNFACWPLGLSADVLCALSDRLSSIAYGAPEIARGRANPFFCAKKRCLEADEPQDEEATHAHGYHPTGVRRA